MRVAWWLLGLVWLLGGVASAAEGRPTVSRPLGEVVVVVTADGEALVGVGEPPGQGRIPALVFFPAEGTALSLAKDAGADVAVTRAVDARTRLSELPTLRRYAARGAPAERVAVLDAKLTDAGFDPIKVDAPAEGADAASQMTADLFGFHRRDAPGTPAPDAVEAVRGLLTAARYGYGHGEPAFDTGPDGKPRMARPVGYQEMASAYACPFPASPVLAPPPGMVLQIEQVGEQTGIVEEAMGQWCDRAARALLKTCGGDGLLEQLEPGPAEVHWQFPPGEGLWWVVPERVVPAGGSSMGGGDSCLTEALADWEISSQYHSTVMRVRLVEDDLQQGCARQVEEKCQ